MNTSLSDWVKNMSFMMSERGFHTSVIVDRYTYETPDSIIHWKKPWNTSHYGPYSGGESSIPWTVQYILKWEIK